MSIRERIRNLQREVDAADRTGQAYARILDTLRAARTDDADPIERDVWAQEISRYMALVDEMADTSVAGSEEIAHLERRAASIG